MKTKRKRHDMHIPEGQHSKLGCLWQSEICRGRSQTPAPLERWGPGPHDASDPNEPPSAFCSIGTRTRGVGKHVHTGAESRCQPGRAVLTLTSWGWAGRTPPGAWAGWEVGWHRTEASAWVRWWPASGRRQAQEDPSTWRDKTSRKNTV